jgi:hypothetical protein
MDLGETSECRGGGQKESDMGLLRASSHQSFSQGARHEAVVGPWGKGFRGFR